MKVSMINTTARKNITNNKSENTAIPINNNISFGSTKSKIIIGASLFATLLPLDLLVRNGEFREKLAKVIPLYEEVNIDKSNTDLKVAGTFAYNGSINGHFDDVNVNLKIDEKVFKLLDERKLVGKYKLNGENKDVNLDFQQKINWSHEYKIKGNFGEKGVDVNFINPVIKTGEIKGKYNSNKVDLKIDRNLANVARDEFNVTGKFNGKKVDLDCKGLFLHGASIEGEFDGRKIKLRTDQKFNLFRDSREINAEFNLKADDKEDLLFLVSTLTMNDLYLHELEKEAEESNSSSQSKK